MMNLLWILLFGHVTPVTETPVHLVIGANEFALRKPISAVTSGAALEIDISTMVPGAELTIDMSQKWVERNIKTGCLKAVLRGRGTSPTRLEFDGGSAFAPDKVFVILSGTHGVPVWQEFESLTLTSCMPLNNVTLYWKNHSV